MPVIGVNEVSGRIPANRWYNDVGQLQGVMARQVTDAILQALLGGQGGGVGKVPTAPTPQRPGKLTFPSGQSTPTSPMEMEQIGQMGGVPTRQGTINPIGQTQTGGVSYAPPTKLGFKPDLAYQARELALQKAQQDLDPNAPMNQYIAALTKQAGTPQAAPQGGNEFLTGLSDLQAKAQAGDEAAVQRIRLIRQLMQGL